MKSALVLAFAAAIVLLCAWQAVVEVQQFGRIAWLSGAVAVAFLLGLGCGERARWAFNRDLALTNKLVQEQNEDLREVNSSLLERINGRTRRADSASPPRVATKGQLSH